MALRGTFVAGTTAASHDQATTSPWRARWVRVADDEQLHPKTILGRMVRAGLDEEKARGHIERGAVRVNGEHVTDPDLVAPWPQRWVIGPE